jgi:DNA-binding transcriptional LysR family regulator
MTLQQLRYLIAVAEHGSINAAAHDLFVSQSNLSVAVRELEKELGVTIFNRSSKGISLTSDGVELLGYARQVTEQADLMLSRYNGTSAASHGRLAISSQHYAFVVRAFIEFANRRKEEGYEFTLRETRTSEVIDDVRDFHSDLGVLYLSTYNERVVGKRLESEGLRFTSLFKARPHVFVREGHPLAGRERIRIEELRHYPRFTFEQGAQSSLYYSEEPLATFPHKRRIMASDRATLTGLLRHTDGFLTSTGMRSDEMFDGIVSIPVESDEVMNVGYITHGERRLSSLVKEYIEHLYQQILGSTGAFVPSRAVTAYAQGLPGAKPAHKGL